jgi:hypothetical protein
MGCVSKLDGWKRLEGRWVLWPDSARWPRYSQMGHIWARGGGGRRQPYPGLGWYVGSDSMCFYPKLKNGRSFSVLGTYPGSARVALIPG